MAQVASPTNAAMAARLERDVANLQGELAIAKRKLSSKSEALIILSADLDACRTERDQYKLMAEQLQARHVAIKKQLAGVVDEDRSGGDLDVDQLWRLLAEHQTKSKAVALEAEDLKQRLAEAEGDNRALREQLGRRRMGEDDEAVSRRSWSASEREALVATLERERKKSENLKRDMREVFDQKEELVVERDSLQSKHERLNKEMNLMLRGDPERILDLDALTMENAYLKQELARTKEEQNKAAATLTKYRGLLEKRMARVMGGGKARTLEEQSTPSPVSSSSSAAGGSIGLPPSVEALCRKLLKVPPDRASPQAVAHLQKFIVFLQETLQDRSVAIVHQRKTNQILGKKIQALENRLRHQSPVAASSLRGQFSHPDDVEGAVDDFISDSLEHCCISDETQDEDGTAGDGGSSRTSGCDVATEGISLSISASATGILMHPESALDSVEAPDSEKDETASVADSFCDFQSAASHDFPNIEGAASASDDLRTTISRAVDAFASTNSLSATGTNFSEFQLRDEEDSPPISKNGIHASFGESPTSGFQRGAKNFEDLLSWEFDDQREKDDDKSPAILTPTVMK